MKLFVLILSFFLCIDLSAQKGNMVLSKWHTGDKIETSDYQMIKKSKLYYFVSNDNDNLYLNIKVTDTAVQNRILREGLTVWINMDGKPVKKMGIRFPVGSQNAPSLSQSNTIELIGFITEQERRFPSDNPDNFRGSVKNDRDGMFYYNMVMPIAKLPVRNSKDGHGAMPFILGVEYGRRGGSNDHQQVAGSVLYWIKNIKLATSK